MICPGATDDKVYLHVFGYIGHIRCDRPSVADVARKAHLCGEMGSLLKKEPQLAAAVAFYLLYAAGLVFFAVTPGIRLAAIYALFLGAALGLIAYGTYDLTNLSVVEGFNWRIALIDLIWGTVLSGATAALVVAVTSKIFTK